MWTAALLLSLHLTSPCLTSLSQSAPLVVTTDEDGAVLIRSAKKNTTSAVTATAPGPSAAPAQRIDLDFVDADIHQVLNLLATVGKVNLVTDDTVQGKVTVSMHDVPWDEAMAAILAAKGLVAVPFGETFIQVKRAE